MKKLLLIPALMLSSVAMATDYKYEISPMIGYNIAEGNINVEDDGYMAYGLELQFNSKDSKISPEFSAFYSKDVDYEAMNLSTDILRVAFNGVYTFDSIGSMIPFAKAGLGYEKVSHEIEDNPSAAFIDAGAGVKIPFTDHISMKLETIYMLKDLGDRRDSNLLTVAGINIAFGEYAQKPAPKPTPKPAPVVVVDGDDDNDGVLNSVDQCPTTPTGDSVNTSGCTVIVDGDDDNDGVLNSVDACPTTPAGKRVNAKGCFVDGDDDNDGVLNSVDQCPTTPAGKKVNAKGCFVDGDDDNDGVLNSVDICKYTPAGDAVNSDGCSAKVNLHVNFENNSYKVDSASDERIQKYADFLIAYTSYSAKIVGHTDSMGSANYNQTLSENRANAVKNLLIEKGVSAYRVSSAGMGENTPIANNATKAGRAENRRIEAELTKK